MLNPEHLELLKLRAEGYQYTFEEWVGHILREFPEAEIDDKIADDNFGTVTSVAIVGNTFALVGAFFNRNGQFHLPHADSRDLNCWIRQRGIYNNT